MPENGVKISEINQDVTAYTSKNIYDFDNHIMLNYYPSRIIEIVQEAKKIDTCSLLELGLGHGYSTLAFYGSFANHVVIDGDKRIIEKFLIDNPQLEREKLELIDSYFENYHSDRKYDVIVAGFILEHVDDPKAILKQYSQMLSDGGRFFITVPNAASLHRRLGFEAGLLKDLSLLSEADINFGHKRYFQLESLKSLITESGMRAKRIEGLFLKPFTTRQLLELNLSADIIDAMCKVGRTYPELCTAMVAECEIAK